MDYLFKTSFAGRLNVLMPSEKEINEIKASIGDLKALLPDDVNPSEEPDLLFIAANLAVAGMVNLNDDGLDIATALQVYKKFEKKQVNIEHNRDLIIGYILKAGLSELGTDRLLTEDEARVANKPFNIATVAVLWKIKAKELCNNLIEASNPLHPDYNALSLSFEMGFNDYSIISLPTDNMDISAATKTINTSDSEYESYSKALRANKGDGLDPQQKGNRIYRVMPQSVIPLGQGLVNYPAAAVKGIVAITQSPIPVVPFQSKNTEDEMAQDEIDSIRQELEAFYNIFEKKTMNDINSLKSRVLHNIDKIISSSNMNKQDFEQVKTKISKAEKLEDIKEAVASFTPIVEAITTESERLASQNKELETQATKAAQAKAEALAAYENLKVEFATIKQQLDEIRIAQAQVEANQKFQDRMLAIEAEFDLDQDERALVIADIKDLDDEAFAKSMDKMKKLMKEKTKAYKKAKSDDDDKKKKDSSDQMCAALAAKGITVKVDGADVNWQEVIASAKSNVVSAPVINTIEVNSSLADKAKEAFADAVTIGGKKISEITKK